MQGTMLDVKNMIKSSNHKASGEGNHKASGEGARYVRSGGRAPLFLADCRWWPDFLGARRLLAGAPTSTKTLGFGCKVEFTGRAGGAESWSISMSSMRGASEATVSGCGLGGIGKAACRPSGMS